MKNKFGPSFAIILCFIFTSLASYAQTAPALQIDVQTLDSYLGEYQLTNDIILTIVREGEKLVVTNGPVKSELVPESFNKFISKASGTHFTFNKNKFGEIADITFEASNEKLTAYKRQLEPERGLSGKC